MASTLSISDSSRHAKRPASPAGVGYEAEHTGIVISIPEGDKRELDANEIAASNFTSECSPRISSMRLVVANNQAPSDQGILEVIVGPLTSRSGFLAMARDLYGILKPPKFDATVALSLTLLSQRSARDFVAWNPGEAANWNTTLAGRDEKVVSHATIDVPVRAFAMDPPIKCVRCEEVLDCVLRQCAVDIARQQIFPTIFASHLDAETKENLAGLMGLFIWQASGWALSKMLFHGSKDETLSARILGSEYWKEATFHGGKYCLPAILRCSAGDVLRNMVGEDDEARGAISALLCHIGTETLALCVIETLMTGLNTWEKNCLGTVEPMLDLLPIIALEHARFLLMQYARQATRDLIPDGPSLRYPNDTEGSFGGRILQGAAKGMCRSSTQIMPRKKMPPACVRLPDGSLAQETWCVAVELRRSCACHPVLQAFNAAISSPGNRQADDFVGAMEKQYGPWMHYWARS